MKRILIPALSLLISAWPAVAQTLPAVIERYEQLLIRSPGKGAAFDKVYQHFFEGDGLEKLAERWKKKADAGQPQAAPYWLLLGILAERQGKSVEAAKLYQKAVELNPAEARAWVALGESQASGGKLSEAIAAFQKALASGASAEMRPPLYRQLALTQQRAFDKEGALKTWEQFVAESPGDPFVLEEAADALVEAERYPEAKALYEKRRDLAGTDAYQRVTAIMKLAYLEEKQGGREKARAIYESALPLVAEASWIHREVRTRIEESYRRQDDLPGLVRYYEDSLQKRPRDVEAALRASDALLELNRKTEAVDWLRQAAEWAPDRQEVQVALAKRLGEIEQPREAVKILTKLTQAAPQEESYRELLGNAHWQVFTLTKDDVARNAAIESWRQLAPETTRDPNKISRVADLFRARDLTGEALQSYERAVHLAPDFPEVRQRWADYLFHLKRDEEAWTVLRGMVAGDRATAPNFLRLARMQQRRKEMEGALDSAARGLALEPRNFELLTLQWRLFSQADRWSEAAALYERMLAAAPSVHSEEQIEEGQVQALRALGRLDEALKQLGARVGKGPALAESELRLLVRLALQKGELPVAKEALLEAGQRFPQSVPLVRRQVDYEKRMSNLPGRIAALERLMELQPRQKLEWLREIARTYQEEQAWDKALAAAQRVIDESPANADSFLLAAEISFAAQRFAAGVGQLREAIKLAQRPNEIRLRLARAFLDAGKIEEARQTYDAAFDAEEDPKTRLSLTRPLAEAYLQQGKLDELIARFRQRQRAEEGGWRYALYLAEIFQQMQDYTAAREELAKALGARSRDGNFLRQLVRLSKTEGNTTECARFTRLLAEAEPSAAHQVELADALLEDGNVGEALEVLRANEERLLTDSTSWRGVLLKVQAAGAAAQLAETLRSGLDRRADDWRTRLTLAEIHLATAEFDAAERLLWEIFAMQPDPAAPSPGPAPSPPRPPSAAASKSAIYSLPSSATSLSYSVTSLSYPAAALSPRVSPPYPPRLSRGYQARASFTQVLSAGKSSSSSRRFSSRSYTTSAPPLKTLEEARDTALIYLALIATQRDRAEAFLAELAPKLASLPPIERLLTYALVEARNEMLREIDQEIESPSGNPEINAFCFQFLVRHARGVGPESSLDAKMIARLESFLPRETNPRNAVSQQVTYHSLLLSAGRREEAKKVADQLLARAESMETDLLPIVFGLAVTTEAFDIAEKLLRRLLEEAQKPGQAVLKQQIDQYRLVLADGLLKHQPQIDRGIKLLADALKESYPTQLPVSLGSVRSVRSSSRSPWRETSQFPYVNSYLNDTQLQRLRDIFARVKAANAVRALETELNDHIQSLPDDQTVYTQLARACFRWWNQQRGDAIRDVHQLARELKDDELRMMVAVMLEEAQQPGDALRVLEQITATSGDLFIEKQIRMLMLARRASDLVKAEKIALGLTEQRLSLEDQSRLGMMLSELGLKEKLKELTSLRTIPRPSGNQQNPLDEQLRRQVSARNEQEAGALARSILARDPFAALRRGSDTSRRQALDALKKFNALGAYISELEKQLAEAPSAARTVYLLAEACGPEDRAKALGYYRKLVELRPADTAFQLRLADLLKQEKQVDEAMRIWEAALSRDPEAVLEERFDALLETYKGAKQTGRLAAALLNAPKSKNKAVAFSTGRADYQATLSQLAHELQREGQLAEAINVWRASVEASREQLSSGELRAIAPLISALVDALLEAGRKEEAIIELENFFFPVAKAPPVLGFPASRPGSSWARTTTASSGRIELSAMGLLLAARQVGALERLREKALRVAAQPGQERGEFLVFFLDLLQRETLSLDEFSGRARNAARRALERRDQTAGQLLCVLAQELREWPEARRLSLQLLQEAHQILRQTTRSYSGYSSFLSVAPSTKQLAELALELGEQEVARTALQEWIDADRAVAGRGIIDESQRFWLMELMAKAGLEPEVRGMLNEAKTRNASKSSSMQRRLAEFENRLALIVGEAGPVRLTVWMAPPAAERAPRPVYWDIGPALKTSQPERGRAVTVESEELPKLNGRYTLELFHGVSESAMEKIATIPAAKARGSWQSPAPLSGGHLRGVLRENANRQFSETVPVPGGPNLLVNPSFQRGNGAGKADVPGWRRLSSTAFTIHAGGPRSGGEYVRFRRDPAGSSGGRATSAEAAISAERIPLRPGQDYLLSAWMRSSSNERSVRIGGRFLDKDGKEVGKIPVLSASPPDRWVSLTRRLVRAERLPTGEDPIPDKAVEFELTIEAAGGGDVDSLFFSEISAEVPE